MGRGHRPTEDKKMQNTTYGEEARRVESTRGQKETHCNKRMHEEKAEEN